MDLFLDSPLSQAVRGYFLYKAIPLEEKADEEDEEEEGTENEGQYDDLDPFDLVLVSLLGCRLFAFFTSEWPGNDCKSPGFNSRPSHTLRHLYCRRRLPECHSRLGEGPSACSTTRN